MRNYTIEHLNSITLKHSGQMCSNDHFYQTTNANFPKQIPTQSLLSNATSNHFFWLPNEKNSSKTIPAKLYAAKECEKK